MKQRPELLLAARDRREAGLAVSDRVALRLAVPDGLRARAEAHQGLIAGEVLATSVQLTGADEPMPVDLGDGASAALTRA